MDMRIHKSRRDILACRINDLGEKDDNGAGVVSVGEYNGNQCYRVIWEHQSIPGLNKDGDHINEIDYSTWSKNIYIRAKEDYVGGNNVPTNVSPDSNVVVNLVSSEFEQPKVNVKPRLYINDLTKTVFAGDTIFMESIGRTDLPTGNMKEILSSVREKILSLPGDTKILPGHGPATDVAYEAANNPYA